MSKSAKATTIFVMILIIVGGISVMVSNGYFLNGPSTTTTSSLYEILSQGCLLLILTSWIWCRDAGGYAFIIVVGIIGYSWFGALASTV